MGHLTYTRKRYNSGKAPEGLDGVDACERECVMGCYTPFLFIWSTALSIYYHPLLPPPRGPCPLKPTFIPCNSFLNIATQCEARVYRLVIAVHWFLKGRPHEHTVENLLGISFPTLSVFLIVNRNEANMCQ